MHAHQSYLEKELEIIFQKKWGLSWYDWM